MKRFVAKNRYAQGKILFIVSIWLCVFGLSAQPTLDKTFTPSTIGPGSTTTITFTITNGTGAPVTGLAFTDVLPTVPGDVDIADPANASTTCDDGVVTAPDGGGTISFSNGRLGVGESCTVTVDVTASTPGVHTNPAVTLSSSAGSSMSLATDLTVVTTLPGFSKVFAPSSVPSGGKSTLTFTIDNSANASPEGSLGFTDILPVGMEIADPPNASTDCVSASFPNTELTAVAGTNTIHLDADGLMSPGFGVVEAGATCTVEVDVVATGVGELDNLSQDLYVFRGADQTFIGRASATLESTITPIAIQKSFLDDPVPPGGTTTLEFTIDNFDRNFSATSVSFEDDFDPLGSLLGLTLVGSLPSDPCGIGSSLSYIMATGEFSLTGGTIPAEGSCTFAVDLMVPSGASPGVYENTTSAVTGTVDGSPITGNMASDDLHVEPVPIITKEFTDDPVNPGDAVVIEFTITNTSPTFAATSVFFQDEFPTITPTASVTPGIGCCGAGSICSFTPLFNLPPPNSVTPATFTLSGGTIAAGATCTFSLTLDVESDASPGLYPNTTSNVTAIVNAETVTGDPASDDLLVIAAPQLTKAFTDDPVAPGETVELEFTLSHSSNSLGDATGISFTDDLTTVLTGLEATSVDVNTCSGATVDISTPTMIDVSGGTLMPGEDCTINVSLAVPVGATPGFHTNTTSDVSATVSGLAATSAAASDDLLVSILEFEKTFLNNPIIGGTTGNTLRFNINNISPTETASAIFFIDDFSGVLSGMTAPSGTLPATPCGPASSLSSIGAQLILVSGELAPNTDCTFDVPITIPAATADGTYTNTTGSIFATVGGILNIDMGSATDVLTVNSTLIGLTKEFTDDPVAPGDDVTLEFKLTNLDATRIASDVGFTDDLGEALTGLTFNSVLFNDCGATVGGTGTDLVAINDASLAAGGSCTIRISATVPGAAAAGVYPNSTSDVTGTIDGFTVTGDAATDDLNVADLLLFSKSFDGPTTATGTAILTFTITNPGTATATGIQFSDNLDDVVTGLIASDVMLDSPPCGAGSSISGQGTGLITFEGGELPPLGGTCSFRVEVTVPETATAGTFPNTTSDLFQSGLVVSEPATADLTIEPPPTFAKTFDPDDSNAGEISTLTFTIDNSTSSVAVSDLDFTDNLPVGITIAPMPNASTTCTGGTITAVAGAGVFSYTGGSVGASATCTVQVDVISNVDGMFMNTSGDLTSSAGNSGTASDTWNVTPAADISVTKTDGVTSATPGGTITYTIVVANAGPSTDPSVSLTDTYPAELTATYTSVAAGGAMSNTAAGAGDLAETLSMPAGSSVTYTVTANIHSDATGTLSNTATVAASVMDPGTGNDSATDDDTVLEPEADISVTKDDGVTSAVPGQTTLTYTIVVANAGPSGDPAVSLTDVFPADLTATYTSVAAGGAMDNTAAGAGDLAETLSMPAGSSVTYTVTASIDPGATGTLSNTATAMASVTDPDTGNNSDTDDDTVLTPEADISVTKDDGVTSATPGGSITYTIVVANAGPSDDPAVSLTDVFPADLSSTWISVAAGGASGNTAMGAGDLSETLNLPVGSSVTYTVTAEIACDATGTISNTATAASSVTDPDPLNDSATDDDTALDPVFMTSISVEDMSSLNPNDGAVCDGDEATLTASGGISYSWSTGDMTASTVVSAAGPHIVTVTNDLGCMDEEMFILTIDPLPTATIMGSIEVCEGDAWPNITLEGDVGPPEYIFTYSINGVEQPPISSTGGDRTIAQSTSVPDTYSYELLRVEDMNTCSQDVSGTAVIVVNPDPISPTMITGPSIICPGLDAIPYFSDEGMFADSYLWEYSVPGAIINGNGTTEVTVDGIPAPGFISVASVNGCGTSLPFEFMVDFATPENCALADCTRDVIFVDNELLALLGSTDIYQAIERIESDATILDEWVKTYRAGVEIDFYPPFTVQLGAIFIAEIADCLSALLGPEEKK